MTYIKSILEHPLILFFVFINLAIGWWAHRKAKAGSFEDYATASKSLPTGVLIMTIMATIVSADELALMDATLVHGMIVPILNLMHFMISISFIGYFISPRLVFYKASTLGGVMKKLYGKGVQLLAGSIHCLSSLGLLITQISTIGIISSKIFKID